MKKFFEENGNAIATLFFAGLFAFCTGKLAEISTRAEIEKKQLSIEKLVGNTAENLAAIKHECEKDLPRNQECVLVYDYVAVNKE